MTVTALWSSAAVKPGSCHGIKRILGKKFTKIRDSIAALDVQEAIIDYAANGIMPYLVLRRTERGVSSREALLDAA